MTNVNIHVFGHATALKLLERVCRLFEFHNTRGISLCSCTRRIPDLHPKKKIVMFLPWENLNPVFFTSLILYFNQLSFFNPLSQSIELIIPINVRYLNVWEPYPMGSLKAMRWCKGKTYTTSLMQKVD